MQQRWLLLVAVVVKLALAASAVPGQTTEQECEKCEQAVKTLKGRRPACEEQIKQAQTESAARIASMKKYFSDVENQMRTIEPGEARVDRELAVKHYKEAEAYKDLRKASPSYQASGSFLQRRDKLSAGCDSACYAPLCVPGDPNNGGSALIDGKCTKYASKAYGMWRYCGEGGGYEGGPSILCSGCLEDVLVDRYMKCEEDTRIAKQELAGCQTKLKTVQMWNSQRERQYKNKADVYIMRVAKQTDPLAAKIEESARVSATITRIAEQVKDLRSAAQP